MAHDIPAAPRSETFSVTELVQDAMLGRLRVPRFQRGIKWDVDDVALLLDSLLRGYPIGSLLLWKGGPPVPPGPAQLGPVLIPAPSREGGRWIVDGQQRVVSLVATLNQAGGTDPRFDIWFDPDGRSFRKRPRGGPEAHWIEVWRLLDAADLGEFLLSWPPGTPDRRRAVLEAGKRIREYRIPCTVIEAEEEAAVRLVFQRMNNQGKALKANEIFDAWAAPGGTLAELAAAVGQLGWGSIEEDVLLRAVLVNEGRDPTRPLTPEDQVDLLSSAAPRLLAGLLRSVEFLRSEGTIPHVRLLPYNTPLQILPAFFARHPDPHARSLTLLARWIWRVMAGPRPTDPVLRRAAARVVGQDDLTEDDRIQALLATAPRWEEPPEWAGPRWSFDQRFRSDSGPGRIALVTLAALGPVDLETGAPIDIAAMLEGGADPASIVTTQPKQGTIRETVANRVLHPPHTDIAGALTRWAKDAGPRAKPLITHAVPPPAAGYLLAGNVDGFLARRLRMIEELVERHVQRLTAFDQDDSANLRELFSS